MTFEDYLSELANDRAHGPDSIDWKRNRRLWVQLEKKAERLVASIAPGAVCSAQEWDDRIDCTIRLPDGSVVGEMVALRKLTEERLRETGDRLRKRADGEAIALVDELRPPVRIGLTPSN